MPRISPASELRSEKLIDVALADTFPASDATAVGAGIDAAKIYRDTFTAAGGQVVAFEAYDPKATEFTGMLLKTRAANPDMVHIHGLLTDVPQVIAQMRQLGMTQRVSSYSVVYNPKVLEQLGAAAEGLIVTSLAPGVNENPKVQPLVDRWVKEFGRVPNGLPYVQYQYDMVVLAKALYEHLAKKNAPATGETLRVDGGRHLK